MNKYLFPCTGQYIEQSQPKLVDLIRKGGDSCLLDHLLVRSSR